MPWSVLILFRTLLLIILILGSYLFIYYSKKSEIKFPMFLPVLVIIVSIFFMFTTFADPQF